MIPSIATVCVSGTLQEKLEAIAAAGFKAVEIFENDLIGFPGFPAVRRICADLGLAIVTCQPFRDFEGMPDPRRVRTFDRAERKFELLQELGTFVCSSVHPKRSAASTGSRATSPSLASGPPSEVFASAMRLWPGGATSMTSAIRGRSYGVQGDQRSGSSWTASTSCLAGWTLRRSAPFRATRSSWCRWPMRRSSRWTISPADATRTRAGIGRDQITLNRWSLELGRHCRTGLEDNVRLDRDTLAPSNAALVKRILYVAGDYGHRAAAVAEARRLLALPPAA